MAVKHKFAGLATYAERKLGRIPNVVAVWELDEESGLVAYDKSIQGNAGVYLTEIGLGSAWAPGGRQAPLFDGSAMAVNIYSAGLASDFSTSAGTALAWFRCKDAGTVGDSTVRTILHIGADVNNAVDISKTVTANTFEVSYSAGGTVKSVSPVIRDEGSIGAPHDMQWHCLGLTWDVSADQVICYVDGYQSGSTQTSLGTWAGALSSSLCTIGASSTVPADPWSGWLSCVALYSRALSADEMQKAANPAVGFRG